MKASTLLVATLSVVACARNPENVSVTATPVAIESRPGVHLYAGISQEQFRARVLPVRADSVEGEWHPVKILEYEWVRGAQPFLLILEGPTTPDTAEWFGTRLRIRRSGEPDLLIVDSIGWGLFHPAALLEDSSKFAPTVIGDDDLYLLPSIYGNAGPPSLAIIGYQFGSSPGSFRLLTIASDGKPTVALFLKNFDPRGAVDLNGDGLFELVGKRAWGEGMSSPNARGCALGSYAPFSVFRFQADKTPQVVEDSTLSRRYNQEHYVWTLETDPYRSLVQWCPGTGYKLSQTND